MDLPYMIKMREIFGLMAWGIMYGMNKKHSADIDRYLLWF